MRACPRTPARPEAARNRAWLRPRKRRYSPSSGASCVLARHGYARVPTALGFLDRPLRHLATGLVHVYRWTLGPLAAGRCKYHPSCSQYAIDALREFGFARGTTLAIWRLARCNPWSHGGVDYAGNQSVFRDSRSEPTRTRAPRSTA